MPDLVAAAAATFPPEDNRPLKVFFEDEARFGRICEPSAAWAPPGVRPVVAAQIVRQYTHAYGAVCPADGEVFSLILPHSDTPSMKLFVRELASAYPNHRMVLILDQAGWHTSNELRDLPDVRLVPLPPYSPELNPVEHLWDHLREKHFRNRLWTSLDDLEDQLEVALKCLSDSPALIQKLCGFRWAAV